MKIAIVSNWRDVDGGGWSKMAAITMPNRLAYAKRHHYLATLDHFPGHFGKVEALLKNWGSADWLWWIDLDAVITAPELTLDGLTESGDVVLTCDSNGLNSGSMLLRCIPEVRNVLERILSLRSHYDSAPWHDQNGFAYQLWSIRDRVRIVERRRMNSYPEDWQPGDFVLHCPGMPNEQRIELLNHHSR